MNLILQFPDISEEMRSKSKKNQRNYKAINANHPLAYSEDEIVSKYFEGEFRRWHIKLFIIIAASLGFLWFTIINISWIYNLITT